MIRLAKEADAPAIQWLFRFARNHDFAGAKYTEEDWTRFVAAPQAILLVDEENGEVTGFALGYDLVTWGYLDLLVVDEPHRNKRIGANLLRRFEEHGAQRWDCVELCVDVDDPALKYYVEKQKYSPSLRKTLWYVK